jgi:hypothetical protein
MIDDNDQCSKHQVYFRLVDAVALVLVVAVTVDVTLVVATVDDVDADDDDADVAAFFFGLLSFFSSTSAMTH